MFEDSFYRDLAINFRLYIAESRHNVPATEFVIAGMNTLLTLPNTYSEFKIHGLFDSWDWLKMSLIGDTVLYRSLS